MSIHVNKGKIAAQCIGERLDYIMNPDKTDGGRWVSSHGCSLETAADEFMLYRQQYRMITGRKQRNEVIAYHTDGSRTRVWTSDALMGRMIVQFVALCYYEYFSEQIRKMKPILAVENGNPEHDSKENMKVEARLKNWLKNTPVYLALQWFDVIEEVNVSFKLHAKRWTTELTERDRMFLIKLGMQVS